MSFTTCKLFFFTILYNLIFPNYVQSIESLMISKKVVMWKSILRFLKNSSFDCRT